MFKKLMHQKLIWLDGAYTIMLRAAMNRSWRDHPTNKELYGNKSPAIQQQRLRFHNPRHVIISGGELKMSPTWSWNADKT
jgi:hypothetical protein